MLGMRARRLLAGTLIALALAPGTFVRTQISNAPDALMTISVVDDLPIADTSGPVRRDAVWHLDSPSLRFGGYSALFVLGTQNPQMRAFSDRGVRIDFPLPENASVTQIRLRNVWNRGALSRTTPDIEAATRDPASGDYWLAFEHRHALIRYDVASEFEAAVEPEQWRDWPENSGAESLARLADGRFLVLPERAGMGLLYSADPTGGGEAITFPLDLPDGFVPTDATALPDGRVLVLLRQLDWHWPPFSAALGVIDPQEIAADARLAVDMLAPLDPILPRDNYEALAVGDVAEDGSVTLWMMSDDNQSSFQRTLLVRLTLESGHEKAREGEPSRAF